MKDWNKLDADVNCILSKHFTKGRSGSKVNKVIVHYNAGNLTVEGCYSVWQSRAASAHYQVEDGGRIGQLVWDSDTAWHAGNWAANCSSIGIEHANRSDGTISEACLDNGAHLVAAICKYYGLGRPEWLKNVFPHKYFAATSCPGQIYGSQKDAYIQRAQQWYDNMVNGAAAPSGGASTPAPAPAPAPTPSIDLGDKRYWGPKYTKEMQRQLGTEQDGIVSRQPSVNKKYLMNADTASWQFTSNYKGGSAMVKALQRKVGAGVDGWMGKETVTKMQQWLEARGYSVGSYGCNGYMGQDTCNAVGRALEAGAFK